MTTLQTARQLLALGLSVIPIPRPRPGVPIGQPGDGKVPAVAWREFQDHHATPAELERPDWFGGTEMNIAVVTGAISELVAVDCDSPDALRWWTACHPYTPWQTKTARGFH